MEGIPLKECTYACDGKSLLLIDVETRPRSITGHGVEPVVEDWHVECSKCHRRFTIRCKTRFVDGERIDTRINLIDDHNHDLGWLGSY